MKSLVGISLKYMAQILASNSSSQMKPCVHLVGASNRSIPPAWARARARHRPHPVTGNLAWRGRAKEHWISGAWHGAARRAVVDVVRLGHWCGTVSGQAVSPPLVAACRENLIEPRPSAIWMGDGLLARFLASSTRRRERRTPARSSSPPLHGHCSQRGEQPATPPWPRRGAAGASLPSRRRPRRAEQLDMIRAPELVAGSRAGRRRRRRPKILMGILCCHAIKVSTLELFFVYTFLSDSSELSNWFVYSTYQVLIHCGVKKIPEAHIMKRWTQAAKDFN